MKAAIVGLGYVGTAMNKLFAQAEELGVDATFMKAVQEKNEQYK